MRKTIIAACTACTFLSTALTSIAQQTSLPVVEREGKSFYYYAPEKGESVFGILSKFGWDETKFREANPGLTELSGGIVIYYPADVVAENKATEPELPVDTIAQPEPEPDVIAEEPAPVQESSDIAQADSVDADAPAPADNELLLPLPSEAIAPYSEPTIYIVKPEDSLISIAREYHTTVADIFSLNPRLTYKGVQPGTLVKLLPGSEMEHVADRAITERRQSGKIKYKIGKTDTWESIAADNKITVKELRDANPNLKEFKSGKSIQIPTYEDITVVKRLLVLDKRESTEEGLKAIYSDVNSFKQQTPSDVNVALLVNTSSAEKKRNIEFMRGFMLGLETLRKTPYKVNLKVVEVNDDTQTLSAVLADEEPAENDIIFATYDKDFPAELIEYGQKNSVNIVNVFDSKDTSYTENDKYIQLLPPSDIFFSRAAEGIAEIMAGRNVLFVEDGAAEGESISAALKDILQSNGVNYQVLQDLNALSEYSFTPSTDYLIVSEQSARVPVMEMIDKVISLKEANPDSKISVLGRPTWLVFSDANEAKLGKADTYFPSRFYLNESEAATKAFERRYGSYYKAHTLKSLPAYAAMGYDVARYFIDAYATTAGDLNFASPAKDMLQLDFTTSSVNNWGGLLNKGIYILNYTPDRGVVKILK